MRDYHNVADPDKIASDDEPDIPLGGIPNTQIFHSRLSPREMEVVPFLMMGFDRDAICEALQITRENLKKIIQRMRQKAL